MRTVSKLLAKTDEKETVDCSYLSQFQAGVIFHI